MPKTRLNVWDLHSILQDLIERGCRQRCRQDARTVIMVRAFILLRRGGQGRGRTADLPLFRRGVSQVGKDRASVLGCCRPLMPVVGCCCCCHRCCQARPGTRVCGRDAGLCVVWGSYSGPGAERLACSRWRRPGDGPHRAGDGPRPVRAGLPLPRGFWPECPSPGSSVTSRVRAPGTIHLCSLPCGRSHA